MAFKRLNPALIQAQTPCFYSARSTPAQIDPASGTVPQMVSATRPMHPMEQPKLTTLPNGLLVATMETIRPIVYISVVIKAGCRYEIPKNAGVTHALRHSFGLTTKRHSTFGLTRNLQLLGATVEAENSRDFMSYKLTCNRNNLRAAIQYFFSMITEPQFFHWELKTLGKPMWIDGARYVSNPFAEACEGAHKTAFRTGYGNSIYCPRGMIGRHDTPVLNNYVRSTFAANRAAIGVVGLTHDAALECANLLQFETAASHPEVPPVYGGGEVRADKIGPYSHVMIANRTAGVKDQKEFAAFACLQHILGTNPRSKGRPSTSRTLRAIKNVTESPCSITSLHHSYTDAGLFAFYVAGKGEDMRNIIRKLFDELNAVNAGVSEQEVQSAKIKAITSSHVAMELGMDLADDLAFNALQKGQIFDANFREKMYESVTPIDVNNAMKKILAGNLTMGAVGNLINTPYVNQLRPQAQAQPQA